MGRGSDACFPRGQQGGVGVATEILLTKAEQASDGRGCATGLRLSEKLRSGDSVSSDSSVCLSDGGGLTLFTPVDFVGLTGFSRVARRHPRTFGVTS
jgi:hypothetical protein